jgi:cation transport ATPase
VVAVWSQRVPGSFANSAAAASTTLLRKSAAANAASFVRWTSRSVVIPDVACLTRANIRSSFSVSMGTAIVSFTYPPIFPLTVVSAIYAGMRIFKNGYNALVNERKLRMDVIGSLYLVCAFVGSFFISC